MTFLDRLAETEYAMFDAPGRSTPTPFGTFVHHPDFPMRYTCNQLLRARCGAGQAAAYFAEVERRYAGLDLAFRLTCGHDPATLAELKANLPPDWITRQGWMMTKEAGPGIAANPAVTIRAVPPDDPYLESLYRKPDGSLDHGLRYYRTQQDRLGGEWLVAYLDGAPVGTTGWFAVGGVARFRFVGTAEAFRRRGVATTLIRHVQDHPEVRRQDALMIYCDAPATIAFYERLGFRKAGIMWEVSFNAPY